MELAQLSLQCSALKESPLKYCQFKFLVYIHEYSGFHIHDKDNGIAVMMGMMRRAISVGNEGGRGGVAHGEAPINPG